MSHYSHIMQSRGAVVEKNKQSRSSQLVARVVWDVAENKVIDFILGDNEAVK